MLKKKKSNFKFQISNFEIQKKIKKKEWMKEKLAVTSMEKKKIMVGLFFDSILFEISKSSSHWTEILSQDIQDPSLWATETLSRDWAIELWSDRAKPRSKLSRQISSHRTLSRDTSQAELSRVFWVLFCYQTQGFIKITLWVWGRMLRNRISHCLEVFYYCYCCFYK